MFDIDGYHEQLQMDTELVDRLVLQLNRIYPPILSDNEACRFSTCVSAVQLQHLHGKGDEACHEFYRGLHIHAEDIYSSLSTRVRHKGKNTEQGFGDTLGCTGPFCHCSAARLSKGAKDVLTFYAEVEG
uniref:caspase recruitment domain-containing protein 19-like n=1 Tax=Monopterus albus TaxID=43700 RepID=UPI0009B45300|nr:caspase recruitment domain-containing protein 19-like [Monopterus albus]